MSKFILAVDLGQSIDPTAIAVLEVESRREYVRRYMDGAQIPAPPTDWFRQGCTPGHFASGEAWSYLKDGGVAAYIDVRHLERLPLRTSYVRQVEIVAAMLKRPPLCGRWEMVDRGIMGHEFKPAYVGRAEVVIDMTGCGRPVFDIFKRAGIKAQGVTITAGDNESSVPGQSNEYRVAKLLLVSRLQALLHSGELRIAAELAEARTLVQELQDFRVNFTEAGYMRSGAREGAHDDLVLAVAIGAWWATRGEPTIRFAQAAI